MLDINLPKLDGWMVMDKLKKNPETRHIPVHFISVHDSSLDAMKMGAIGYLTKPVSLEQLREAFEKIEDYLAQAIKELLIVEDDEVMRNTMVELLHGRDLIITAAATGQEAYKLLTEQYFDCVVLDLGLTDMSGFELLERIHQDRDIADLPIIVYTGRELTHDEELELKRYADSIILKGVKSHERLLDEVTLFLHRVETICRNLKNGHYACCMIKRRSSMAKPFCLLMTMFATSLRCQAFWKTGGFLFSPPKTERKHFTC